MTQKPFCGDIATLPFLATLSLQTPRSQECASPTSTSQKYLPELTRSWPSTQGRETNLCEQLGSSWHVSFQVTPLPSSDRKRAGWAVAASRVRFTAKTRDHQVSGISVGLGQSLPSVRASLTLGRSSSPLCIFPGTTYKEQGLSWAMIDSPVWNSSFLQSARNKWTWESTVWQVELSNCPEHYSNKLLNSRITANNKEKASFIYLNLFLQDAKLYMSWRPALLIQNSYRINICYLFRMFERKYSIWWV